ncbi:TIGR01777 family oxidoreductase [Marinimicrobium agarilyticum]|uniref:TIGR01777 family oxidoreductase n=1 Tax=Marinimicrobium agarilyticum TaxID=306546 RepID=UPI000419DBBF|nr:TIGR01777 family oxidoreductase [Marinimicrobium agarilyticum]
MSTDNHPREILLTGGTGFIGVPLCHALQKRGDRLTILTRDTLRAAKTLGTGVNLVSELKQLPDKPIDTVINLAGEPLAAGRWNERRKEEFRRSRIGTTEALFEHFQSRGQFPERMVSGSAIGFYGDGGDAPLTESNDAGSGFAAQLCLDWEAVAERFSDHGTRVCRLRTGIVLGEGGGALQSMLLPFKLGLGGRLGSGRQWMSWIHRDDIVALILHCLDSESLSGPVNGTAPNPVTNRQFTRTLAKVLHRPAIFPMPAFVLRTLMADMADELLLASQRVLPEVAIETDFRHRFPDLEVALENILKKR